MYNILEKNQNIYVLEKDNLVEKYNILDDINSLEGNIYVSKVKDVKKGLEMAFVDIDREKMGVIPFSEYYKTSEEDMLNILKTGNEIVVQIKRGEIEEKGAKLTTEISLAGEYLIYLPYSKNGVYISSKMENIDEKKRLRKIVQNILPKNTGAIIRTEAKWRTQLELQKDLEKILIKWKEIDSKIKSEDEVPRVVYQNDQLIDKIITNITIDKIEKIVTDNIETREKYSNKVHVIYQEEFEIISDIQKQIDVSENRKIWLKSGGYIAIDKTEALTAIDVNSGKYVSKSSAESTFLKVNMEATYEIAKQLRLRNISGMIVVDYINMEDEFNMLEIFNEMKELLKQDRIKSEVYGFTKMNLFEIVRQHQNG